MKRSSRARVDVNVELTPLIDVVFLLLIFFMVSTTFIRETQLKIDLPEASGELQEVDDELIEISISERGRYSVNGRVLVDEDIDTLVRALKDARAAAEEVQRLVVTADGQASHQSVVRAMDAAGKVGLTRISITTRQPDDED